MVWIVTAWCELRQDFRNFRLDRIRSLTGVVDYTFGNYKIQPDEYQAKIHKMPMAPISRRSGGFGNTRITSYNVENLFDLDLAAATAVLSTTQLVAGAVRDAFKADGIMLNQFNGPAAGQTVFHFHMHIVPRYENVPLRRHTGDMEDSAVLEEQAGKIRALLG